MYDSCSVVSDSLWPHGILQARILEWVAFPFSRGSSQPRDQTQVSHIAGGFFTSWATREAQSYVYYDFGVIISLVLIFPKCWDHTLCNFLRLLIWLSNVHLSFLHVFSWSDTSCLLVLNNIPLSECTTVYLFIIFLKDILVTSTFWQSWTKLL